MDLHCPHLAEIVGSLMAQMVESLPAVQETWGSIPESGTPPGEGHGNPLQYSCLENPTDRGAWRATVHRVTKTQTWLSDSHTHTHTPSSITGISPVTKCGHTCKA